jgi:hypothetical protein
MLMEPGAGTGAGTGAAQYGDRGRDLIHPGPTQFACGTAVQRSWRAADLTLAKVSATFASDANADTATPERLGSG